MATSLSKAISQIKWTCLLGFLFLGPSSVWAQSAELLVDSFCFPRTYGGYRSEGLQSDGMVHLSAEAMANTVGITWVIELVLSQKEIRQIWINAATEKLSPADMNALLQHCDSKNQALESALKKEAFNRYIDGRPSWDQLNKRAGVPLPVSPIPSKATFSAAEEDALAKWRNDTAAATAAERLKSVSWAVFQGFLSISQGRARHIPNVQKQESASELSRRLLGIPPVSK